MSVLHVLFGLPNGADNRTHLGNRSHEKNYVYKLFRAHVVRLKPFKISWSRFSCGIQEGFVSVCSGSKREVKASAINARDLKQNYYKDWDGSLMFYDWFGGCGHT